MLSTHIFLTWHSSTNSNLANVLLNKIWYSFVPSVPRYLTLTPPWVHCKSQASMGPWSNEVLWHLEENHQGQRGCGCVGRDFGLQSIAWRCGLWMFMGPREVGKIMVGGARFLGWEKGGWKLRKVYILTPNITPGPGGFEVLCPKYHSERFNLKIDWKRKILYVFDLSTLHFLGSCEQCGLTPDENPVEVEVYKALSWLNSSDWTTSQMIHVWNIYLYIWLRFMLKS